MTTLPESTEQSERTTFMRRYTLKPDLVNEFLEFFTTKVIPAREDLGFIVESIWLDSDKSQLTWFVSRKGSFEEFSAAEQDWEGSQRRAEIFANAPEAVTAKDVRHVNRLR